MFKLIKKYVGKIGTLNIVLIAMFIFFIWFNSQMLTMFKEQGSIPESYAITVVGATIGECGICGWIRTNKDRKKEREWQLEDREHEENRLGKEIDE